VQFPLQLEQSTQSKSLTEVKAVENNEAEEVSDKVEDGENGSKMTRIQAALLLDNIHIRLVKVCM
jgi:hypothetical protein